MLQKQSDLGLRIPDSQISPFCIVVREKEKPNGEVWMSDNGVVSSEHLNACFFTCSNLPPRWEAVTVPTQLVELGIVLVGFAATLREVTGQSLEAPVPVKCCKPDLRSIISKSRCDTMSEIQRCL